MLNKLTKNRNDWNQNGNYEQANGNEFMRYIHALHTIGYTYPEKKRQVRQRNGSEE